MINNYANYEWFLKEDLSTYAGRWVAILNKQVVVSDKNVNKLMEEVKKKFPNERPLVTKIRNKLSIL